MTTRRCHEECPPGGRARRETPRPTRIRRPTPPRVRANRGIYKASEDAMMLAFLNHLESLDAFTEKHLDLTTKAATP